MIKKTDTRRSGLLSRRQDVVASHARQPKRIRTKALLIETAERLFGQHGFDGISLREIALAAGQANSNVVQYHFMNKDGLITGILHDRLSRIEAFRHEFVPDLEAGRVQDPRELLRILWLPLLTIRDHEGNHTFSRFLLQYMVQPRVSRHPLFTHLYSRRPGDPPVKRDPCVVKATDLLHDHCRHLRPLTFARRLAALSMMFHSTVIEYDNARLRGAWRVPAEFDAEPILDMALGALAAPG
jgi:AcrR family transcriptional regulator